MLPPRSLLLPRTLPRTLLLGLSAALSLHTLAIGGTTAKGQQAAPTPAAAATTSKAAPAATKTSSTSVEADSRVYLGTWALGDGNNNLFNVRLFPGGKAISTSGADGPPAAGGRQSSADQLREIGRWTPWGNGVRIDYSDGWSDMIYVGPEGLSHASWQPGQNRGSVPTNFGPAVKLTGPLAQIVGVYSFAPAQSELKPYAATLLSNGLAFNDIDARTGGVWALEGSTVVIDWISGWRTTMSIDPATPLQLRHWAPGADRKGPETGGIRQGKRID